MVDTTAGADFRDKDTIFWYLNFLRCAGLFLSSLRPICYLSIYLLLHYQIFPHLHTQIFAIHLYYNLP